MSDGGKPRNSRMRAQESDPWVSISLAGECTFCARAGRFQHEQSQEDNGEEDLPPPRRGWYRPPFSIDEIEFQIQRLKPKALTLVVIALLGGCFTWATFTGLLATDVGPMLPFVAGIATAAVSFWAIGACFALVALHSLLAKARASARGEPNPNATQPQRVAWWSLLQAGFMPQRYEDPLSDPVWKVTGKPWRILHRGSTRVPVFRKRSEDERLYRQHFARIAGYAHLLEKSEGAKVPYGIVLLGSSYEGLAVPITPPSKKDFHDALIMARQVIRHGDDQPPPRHANLCRKCPWGKPMSTDRGRSYQSPCGERYHWIPPHEKAFRKGLI